MLRRKFALLDVRLSQWWRFKSCSSACR